MCSGPLVGLTLRTRHTPFAGAFCVLLGLPRALMNKTLRWCTCAPYDAPMPAKNPRLTITLQPVIAAQLRRLSELTGNSQSALIAELLDGTSPVFDRVIRVLEAAQQAQNSIKGSLAHSLDDAQTKVEQQLGLVLDLFDDATLPLLADLETVKRRSRPRPGGTCGSGWRRGGRWRSQPPCLTGGSGQTHQLQKQ